MRKTARDIAFKLVFESLINQSGGNITYRKFCEPLDADDRAYVDEILSGVRDSKTVLDGVIEGYASGFSLSRIYKIDRAVLLVAVYEILYKDDVPVKVSANEAVELAKTYSTDNSPAFINGILASVIKDRDGILSAAASQAPGEAERAPKSPEPGENADKAT
ncbi:MAG: transcription antitermination factor NusB [Clostridiales bacterium]|nr:transcription antitermination factor NusB [Clostridiales bacterium]